MRKRLLLFLALSMSAQASEQFGGVFFDTSVEQVQINALKKDLVYLYNTPQKHIDQDLLFLGGLKTGQGPELHNWMINRLKYIVGEDFDLTANTYMVKKPVVYPNTPLPLPKVKPKLPYANFKSANKVNSFVVMSNPSGGFYVQGKKKKRLLFTKLDGARAVISSPRVGLVQVGQGLFRDRDKLGKNTNAPGYAIYRLSTLIHEGRHTDGSGVDIGFRHDYCPLGHPFENTNACESAGNGPYTVGTLAKRQLLRNCTNCTTAEKTFLLSSIADGFSRLLRPDGGSNVVDLEKEIENHQMIYNTYEKHLGLSKIASEKAKITKELAGLQKKITTKKAQITALVSSPKRTQIINPTPEGYFKTISLKDSQLLMQRSLK
jgi:hypothetical protein